MSVLTILKHMKWFESQKLKKLIQGIERQAKTHIQVNKCRIKVNIEVTCMRGITNAKSTWKRLGPQKYGQWLNTTETRTQNRQNSKREHRTYKLPLSIRN